MRVRVYTAAVLVLLLVVCLCVEETECRRKSRRKKNPVVKDIKNVFERGLVTENVSPNSIVREHSKYAPNTAHRNFTSGEVLAYVTPWNNHGYDIAKIFNHKFTYVSPCWFDIKRVSPQNPRIEGEHNVDVGWMRDVRAVSEGASPPKIVPRFLFDGWGYGDYEVLFSNQENMDSIINAILDVVSRHEIDGLVLDSGSLGQRVFQPNLSYFVIKLANALHDMNKEIILVMPVATALYSAKSPGKRTLFDVQDLYDLGPYVDGFSLMSYDMNEAATPGPNAPLDWLTVALLDLLGRSPGQAAEPVHDASLARKLMMGLNFYGSDYTEPYGLSSMIGPDFVDMLRTRRPSVRWDPVAQEHIFSYKDETGRQHHLYFPTLESVFQRIKLAKELGISLAIWEVGQGLDFFYDLL